MSVAVAWEPQPGPQRLAISCPVEDLMYGGARGGGKTDYLLGDWADHQDMYGQHARGLLLRRTYPELDEIFRRSRDIYPHIGGDFIKSEKRWQFASGAELNLRHLEADEDADLYIGHQYTWIAIDQLELFPRPDPVDRLRGTLRSAHGVPCFFRSTANPGGPGHTWVKERYVTPARPYQPHYDAERKVHRVYVPAKVHDNQILLRNDPGYPDRLRGTGPAWLVRAWLDGDWDIVPGSYLEQCWDPAVHVVEPFLPPLDWRRWRALDWGYAAPYSVGWYAMDTQGVIYRYRELYGWSGRPNIGTREPATTVARKIARIEAPELQRGCRFIHNPADTQIWGVQGTSVNERENTLAEDFEAEGVAWAPAKKGPSSRVLGAMYLAQMLHERRFYVSRSCRHWLRTVPVMVPDPDHPEDILDGQEDHAWDEVRYALRSRQHPANRTRPRKDPPAGSIDWMDLVEAREREERSGRKYQRLTRPSNGRAIV